jgi:hypothetical protein
MDLVFQDGYSLILVIWGIIWVLGGAGLVVLLVKSIEAESRAVTRAETLQTATRIAEREVARVT